MGSCYYCLHFTDKEMWHRETKLLKCASFGRWQAWNFNSRILTPEVTV